MNATISTPTRIDHAASDATLPAIITPTIEGREHLLAEAMTSVQAQTITCHHHVSLDALRVGPAQARNEVLTRLHPDVEIVGFLDDDDTLDADHVESLLAALDDDYDLAFSWYRSEGAPETERVYEWDDYAYGVMLSGRNLIPVTVLAKRSVIMAAGGFDPADRYEDYALWMRMLSLGARFAVVPRETWTYRQRGGNRTWIT